MNKEELKQVVDRVHANWNIQPLPAQLQTIYKTWFTLLESLDYTEVDSIITQLAKEDSWAPRPGTIYRRTVDPDTPSPAFAWSEYRTIAAQMDSGAYTPANLHPILQKTITTIGGFNLHTNADREHFIQIYTEHVNKEYK
jgi:hypothetical protein